MYNDGVFMTEWFDTESQFEKCMEIIDRVRDNCVMKTLVAPVFETEHNKCVSSSNDFLNSNTLDLNYKNSDYTFATVRYPR